MTPSVTAPVGAAAARLPMMHERMTKRRMLPVYRPYERKPFPSFEPRVKDVLRNWGGRVESPNLVHERRELTRQFGVFHLEDVFGVPLAGVREVVASGEEVVVGDDDFGVHEVVYVSLAVRHRVLSREAALAEDAPDRRHLPLRVPV